MRTAKKFGTREEGVFLLIGFTTSLFVKQLINKRCKASEHQPNQHKLFKVELDKLEKQRLSQCCLSKTSFETSSASPPVWHRQSSSPSARRDVSLVVSTSLFPPVSLSCPLSSGTSRSTNFLPFFDRQTTRLWGSLTRLFELWTKFNKTVIIFGDEPVVLRLVFSN